jgi:hypothetical protein
MAINIQQIPNAPGGYSLTGKKIMVHDQTAPLESSTVMVAATSIGTGGGEGGLVSRFWKEADADMTAGLTTFQHADLIGASELHEISVNKVLEYLDEDFTFDDVTGTITRLNQWFAGDKMVAKFKLAI